MASIDSDLLLLYLILKAIHYLVIIVVRDCDSAPTTWSWSHPHIL